MIFPILLLASISDLNHHRVTNGVILYGLFLSLLSQLLQRGFPGFIYWLMGGVIPLSVGFFLYRLRFFGAADIKLFSIIGSMYSAVFAAEVFFWSLVFGAFFSVLYLLKNRCFYARFLSFIRYVSRMISTRRVSAYERKVGNTDGTIPFVISISLAVLYCQSR